MWLIPSGSIAHTCGTLGGPRLQSKYLKIGSVKDKTTSSPLTNVKPCQLNPGETIDTFVNILKQLKNNWCRWWWRNRVHWQSNCLYIYLTF